MMRKRITSFTRPCDLEYDSGKMNTVMRRSSFGGRTAKVARLGATRERVIELYGAAPDDDEGKDSLSYAGGDRGRLVKGDSNRDSIRKKGCMQSGNLAVPLMTRLVFSWAPAGGQNSPPTGIGPTFSEG